MTYIKYYKFSFQNWNWHIYLFYIVFDKYFWGIIINITRIIFRLKKRYNMKVTLEQCLLLGKNGRVLHSVLGGISRIKKTVCQYWDRHFYEFLSWSRLLQYSSKFGWKKKHTHTLAEKAYNQAFLWFTGFVTRRENRRVVLRESYNVPLRPREGRSPPTRPSAPSPFIRAPPYPPFSSLSLGPKLFRGGRVRFARSPSDTRPHSTV